MHLRGTVRTFKAPVQDFIERRIEQIARNVAAAFGASAAKFRYERRYPATVNSETETEFAASAAAALVGMKMLTATRRRPWAARISPGCS